MDDCNHHQQQASYTYQEPSTIPSAFPHVPGPAAASVAGSTNGEEYEGFEIIPYVVVTGFGTIYPDGRDENNLSWRVVEKLSETITTYQGKTIPVIKGQPNKANMYWKPDPVKVCYSYIEDDSKDSFKQWLYKTDALVYLHLGVGNAGPLNKIHLETRGSRDVDFIPDKYRDDDTPSRIPSAYDTSFPVRKLCEDLQEEFKSGVPVKSCNTDSTQLMKLIFKESNNAGRFLCEYLYYTSLDLADKRNKSANVLFVHIPDDLFLQDRDNAGNCTQGRACERCDSEKTGALAEVIEFLIKELLAQVDAGEDHYVPYSTVKQEGRTVTYYSTMEEDREVTYICSTMEQEGCKLKVMYSAVEEDRKVIYSTVEQEGHKVTYSAVEEDRKVTYSTMVQEGRKVSSVERQDHEIMYSTVKQ